MTVTNIVIPHTEDSKTQFKLNVNSSEALASEMAAFANSEGGTIYIGVADNGSSPGISRSDVARINQLISNAASHLIRSPIEVQTENLTTADGKFIIVLKVPRGLEKPYFDKNGIIWSKCGSDKRRINSKEILRRLFQDTGQLYAEEMPVRVSDCYQKTYP